jgi:hypothetical protein
MAMNVYVFPIGGCRRLAVLASDLEEARKYACNSPEVSYEEWDVDLGRKVSRPIQSWVDGIMACNDPAIYSLGEVFEVGE